MILGNKKVESDRPALVMGIVNATPDSFLERSRGGLNLALKLIDDGADILDIGGESTRPGFTEVSEKEEIDRIIPIIKEIRKRSDIAISVDTRKKNVMEAAWNEGADIFNDVSAFEYDEKSADFAAKTDLSVILMFSHEGDSKICRDYLKKRVDSAVEHGIKKEKIILDPGIGFDKTFDQNCDLIKNCSDISFDDLPVLMALSNKRCIGAMTGRDVLDRDSGTNAANLISVLNGARIVRVHNVAQTVDTLNVMKFLR